MDKVTNKKISPPNDANCFDREWYLNNYPDVVKSGLDPELHFEKYGKVLGRVSSGDKYLKNNFNFFEDYRPCYRDHLRISDKRKNGLALDATILRTKSIEAREMIAWKCSSGNLNCNQLYVLLSACRIDEKKEEVYKKLDELKLDELLRFAKIIALQSIIATDRLNALAIYEYVLERSFDEKINSQYAKIAFDLAYENKKFKLARRILNSKRIKLKPDPKFYSAVDMLNPFSSSEGDIEKWLSSKFFNRVFERYGLETIDIVDGEGNPFDRLSCTAKKNIDSSYLVTVVISVWKPDVGLITSVQSIINQSWQNLEILIIDDACGDEYKEIIDQARLLDERIRYFRQDYNQGTYMARNLAMKEAKGNFITFHDADDWCHPRRIELQVMPLLENEELIATTSNTVRVTDDLVFSYLGYPVPKRLNTSSLMYDLKKVKDTIGYYDCSRKGADSEYLERIKLAFGNKAYLEMSEVLSIVRLSTGSLSRSEFSPGWHHPARMSYKSAYIHWHNKIKNGEVSPYLEEGVNNRRFPQPNRFKIIRDVPYEKHYDVIIVGDWRKKGGPQNSMIQEIYALVNGGYRVAVSHLEAFRFMTTDMLLMNNDIQELINVGFVDYVSFTDEVCANKIILRYPPILQFLPEEVCKIKAEELYIVANQAPYEQDYSDVRYEVDTCIINAKKFFQIDGVWVPQGPLVRDTLENHVPQSILSTFDLLGVINVDEWVCARKKLSGDIPVIGRYSRDDLMKFPESKDLLLKCYPTDRALSVKIMGGVSSCNRLLGEKNIPKNWKMFNHDEIHTKDFLNKIDFFVYFDNSNIVEAFGRSILEALASGTVTILPIKFKRVFGDAAIYCEPKDVKDKIMQLSLNRKLYNEVSAKSIEFVKEKFSQQAYIDKVIGNRCK